MLSWLDVLKDLSNAFGAPGFEEEITQVIQGYLDQMNLEYQQDILGNLFVTLEGEDDFRVMIDAHMDEVAFMVSHIHEAGFLYLTPLGGWDNRILLSHSITVQTRDFKKIRGIIGSTPPHILSASEKNKVLPLDKLFVDVGARSKEEVESWGIQIGDPAILYYPFEELNDYTVAGKAFDNRVGCTMALALLEELRHQKLPYHLTVVFTTSEEVGLRGASTAAYQVRPDLALVLECTVGADVPGVRPEKMPTALGKGPAITIADRRTIVPRSLISALQEVASKNHIPYQLKTPGSGGTDGGAIQLSRGGVATMILSVPCRYIHAPISMARKEDIQHTIQLAKEFLTTAILPWKEKYGSKSYKRSLPTQ
ncbi:MAG: M42 family peptidase [Planctomycetota bacterium]|nr:MAG: M42 family peptidase [Planctomycetota bacterium]